MEVSRNTELKNLLQDAGFIVLGNYRDKRVGYYRNKIWVRVEDQSEREQLDELVSKFLGVGNYYIDYLRFTAKIYWQD